MRVSYRKPCHSGITQYVTVISLPDEATVYATIFRASQAATVKISPLFPLRASAPPGFEKAIEQHRGERWLNMGDHIGFVSVDPLPNEIPSDCFFLTEEQTIAMQPDEWFGRAALVAYARQPHGQTAEKAPTVRLLDDQRPQTFKLTLETSSGNRVLEFDFAVMDK
jgi:hypothetical protein